VVDALFFVWQGMPQNLNAYIDATTLEGAKQTRAQGPVASQKVVKVLGTNGGGFLTPTRPILAKTRPRSPISRKMLLLIGIAAALTNVLDRMVKDERQGWARFAAMGILLFIGVATVYWSEAHGNPALAAFSVDSTPGELQAGGNMEGKEVRLSIAPSSLFATVTTDAGGAVDAMHDSSLPLGGMVLIVHMVLGEVAFGGVGSGLYGMLAFAIVTMFVAGLMVGRTLEYLSKSSRRGRSR
jgi:K+-transporting ATPase ATPase A chain